MLGHLAIVAGDPHQHVECLEPPLYLRVIQSDFDGPGAGDLTPGLLDLLGSLTGRPDRSRTRIHRVDQSPVELRSGINLSLTDGPLALVFRQVAGGPPRHPASEVDASKRGEDPRHSHYRRRVQTRPV